VDLYGTSEVMALSWECPSGSGYHINSDAVVVDVVDEDGRPATMGEPGDVVVTALWNRTAPIVRYRLADITTLLPHACPCGITLPLMDRVEGRSLDWIIAPDGHRVSPFRLMLITLLGEDVSAAAVRRYRVTQRAPDDFAVEIVWADGPRQDIVERLAPAISWVLGAPVRVECHDVPEIPLEPSQKFRQVVSLVGRATAPR
jgi:phenylacetate-CoA ligase